MLTTRQQCWFLCNIFFQENVHEDMLCALLWPTNTTGNYSICAVTCMNRAAAMIGQSSGFCQFSSAQSLSCVQLFMTPWTAACQASLSITNFWSLLKLMSIELVMPSNYLILCHLLLLPPSIFPSIRVFSNESVLHIRWPSFGVSALASVLPMNIQD